MKTHIRWMRSVVVTASEEVPPVLIVRAQSAPLLLCLVGVRAVMTVSFTLSTEPIQDASPF